MRSKVVAFLLVFGWACGERDEPPPIDIVQTPLSGAVFLAQPSPGASVETRDFLAGRDESVVASAVADEDGRWSLDLGALSGDFVVEAITTEGFVLTAIASDLDVGRGSTVIVSPITALASGYIRYLLSTGYEPSETVLKAKRLFHLHFGRLDHHKIEPESALGRTGEPLMMLTPPVSSGILLAGLELLLEELAAGSTSAVLETLVSDVETDGVFDGQRRGEELPFGLDGQTLRRRYADAIRRFLASDRNGTIFSEVDLAQVIQEIELSQSELFPSGVADGDQTGPVLTAFELLREGGEAVDPARGVRGRLSVRAAFVDASTIVEARLEDPSGAALEDQSSDPERIEALIDTSTLSEGMSTFRLVAVDAAENVTRMDVVLLVDKTAPALTIEAPATVATGRVTIAGNVADEISGVDVVEVGIFGQPPMIVSEPGESFSVVVPLVCNVVEDVDVVARDRAGNEARTLVNAYCDDQAPEIQLVASTFLQEGGMTLELAGNSSVSYLEATAQALAIDEQTAWPIRIEKFFNRFDDQSPNLPQIQFFAVDRVTGGGSTGEVEVAFRYLVDGVERRPFSVLARPSAGEPYAVPITYQMLGTDLGTAGRDALHRVEVVATDAAGNRAERAFDFFVELLSPPVWLTGCGVANEARNHTLAAGNFHTLYGSGAETDVAIGELRYQLDVPQGTLTPGGGAAVEPTGIDVRTRILELGEDKFQEATSRDFIVGSIEDLGQYCPFNTPGVYLNQVGVNENTRVFDQRWNCVQGLSPNDRTFLGGAMLNDDLPHATSTIVTSQAGGGVASAGGVYSIGSDAAFSLTVQMRDPAVLLQGAMYDWSVNPASPPAYVATIANANARYRMPVALGLHHVGTDRWDVPNGGWAQQRDFETRSYVRRAEIATSVEMTARHGAIPDLAIDVRRDASCAAPIVYSSQL